MTTTEMKSVATTNTRNPARRVLMGGLGLAAAGLVVEVLSGVPGFPTVPPGPIILAVAAVFVALAPWRWAPIVGLVAAVFITVGNVVSDSGAIQRLGDPGSLGPFAGTALFLLGLLLALVAGVVASIHGLRRH